VLVPTTVAFARGFAAVFELPFQRHRGWTPLRRAIRDRVRRPLSGRPAGEVELVGQVDQLATGQLSPSGGRPVGELDRRHET
jgi:hypothetical protein